MQKTDNPETFFQLRQVDEGDLPPKTKGRQKTKIGHYKLAKAIFSKFGKSGYRCAEVWLDSELSEARNPGQLASNINCWWGEEVTAFIRTFDVDEQLETYFPMLKGRVRFVRLFLKKTQEASS